MSFFRLSMPRLDANEVIAAAKDFGYDGIELRHREDLFCRGQCSARNLGTSLRQLAESGLEIPCVRPTQLMLALKARILPITSANISPAELINRTYLERAAVSRRGCRREGFANLMAAAYGTEQHKTADRNQQRIYRYPAPRELIERAESGRRRPVDINHPYFDENRKTRFEYW